MTKNSPFTSVNSLIVLIYINNIKIIGSKAVINSLKQQLYSKFKIINIGFINYYFGMTIIHNHKLKTIIIQQRSYLKYILQTFYYWDNKHNKPLLNLVKTPMDKKN